MTVTAKQKTKKGANKPVDIPILGIQFIMNAQLLLKKLDLLGKVAELNIERQAIHIKIQDGKLLATAANYSQIQTIAQVIIDDFVEVDVVHEGEMMVPAEQLIETLKTLGKQRVHFSIIEKRKKDEYNREVTYEALQITHDKGKAVFALDSLADSFRFPKIDEGAKVAEVQDIEAFSKSLQQVFFAAHKNEILYPSLAGVYFDATDEGLRIVATDKHRLVKKDTSIKGCDSFLIRAVSAKFLTFFLNGQTGSGQIVTSDKSVWITTSTLTICIAQLDAQYINYKQFFEILSNSILTIDRLALIKAIDTLEVYSDSQGRIILDIDQSLTLFSQDKISGRSAKVKFKLNNDAEFRIEGFPFLTIEGKPIRICYTYPVLRESLAKVESEVVQIRFTSPNRPTYLSPVGSDVELIHILMPAMLEEEVTNG